MRCCKECRAEADNSMLAGLKEEEEEEEEEGLLTNNE